MSLIPPHLLQFSSAPPIADRGARVLYVRGEDSGLPDLKPLLTEAEYDVDELSSTDELFEVLDRETVDLIILDCQLADPDFDICREIRIQHLESHAPVLLVSAGNQSAEFIAEGLLAGADDFVTDPSRSPELLARIAVQIRNKQYRDALRRIRLERDDLRRDVQVDPLTGALNRRTLERMLQNQFNHGQPFALLYLDIDHFKAINDKYGHDAGDRVLKEFCRALHRGTRGGDALGRWGGEEFIAIIAVPTKQLAVQVAERHREAIATMHRHAKMPCRVTVSIGLALYNPETEESPDGLLRRADAALYEAKHGGRNRVWVASEAPITSYRPVASGHPDSGPMSDAPAQIESDRTPTIRRA